MAEKINWSFAMQVVGGPLVAGAATMSVEAYDKVQVTVENTKTQQVDLAPGGSGPIQLVVINPAKPHASLTYKVGGNDVGLDGPHVLVGAGAVKLLGASASSLSLTNNTGADAAVEILVGRDATP